MIRLYFFILCFILNSYFIRGIGDENILSSLYKRIIYNKFSISFNPFSPSFFKDKETLLSPKAKTGCQNYHADTVSPSSSLPSWRFAEKYSIDEIMEDPVKAEKFKEEYVLGEREFFKVARHPQSGLSYDGVDLDPKTGKLLKIRNWSAVSKECLDIGINIKGLEGDKYAVLLISGGDREDAQKISADILNKKIDSYFKFYNKNPQYKGFIPWFYSGEEINPTPQWSNMAPGLDNGEWIWSLLIAERVLRKQGYIEIADKYLDYIKILRKNVVSVFYDPVEGKVRDNVKFIYQEGDSRKGGYITGEHGVHEGMMMVLFITLFGEGLPGDAPHRIWKDIEMKRIEHKYGTTWQGYWGSAHESWAYLFLPLRDIEGYKNLFRIREIIRCQNAVEQGYPGFASSANQPGKEGYLDGAGIEGVGSQPITNNHIFAVYGVFPMLLEFSDKNEKNYAIAWLLNMLKAPEMQTPMGVLESATNDGRYVCYTKTQDGSFLNILALSGGLEGESREMLKYYNKYQQFISLMKMEYDQVFSHTPLREPAPFILPQTGVAQGIPH